MTDARTRDRTGGGSVSSHAHAVLLSWGPTVLFGMLLPWITYHQLTGHDVQRVPALVLVSAWPALEIGLYFALHHRVDEFGTLILVALLLAAAMAVAGNHWAGGRADAALTGLAGAAFAVSPAFGRPLTYWFGRRFATDGSVEGAAWWSGLWVRDARFKVLLHKLAAVWGAVWVVEAGAVAVFTPRLHGAGVDALSLAAPVVVTVALAAYTTRVGRAYAAAGQMPDAPSSVPTA
ncbi:VC0807 family protein [Streptomyces sp. NPDC049040]|uniref:VC0807 family protein n=1 Tax=Streptomyces sp. NPDC049040 TaxID=3365593 RepID=UPI003718ECB8